MENITIKISEEKYPEFRRQKSIFGWEVIKENHLEDNIIEATMIRDNEVPYYDELVILEKGYFVKPINWAPIIIVFAALALTLLTVFAIFKFIVKENVMPDALLYTFLFGGMGLTILSLVICFLFSKRTLKGIEEPDNEREQFYMKKVEELKNNGK